MTISLASERKLLAHDEFELIRTTHHPDIQSLDLDALRKARGDIRGQLERVRTISRHKRREVRGKGEARASGASGNAEHAQERKQVFAQALRRTNRQIARKEAEEARARTADGVRRALNAKRANAAVRHPGPGRTANAGAVDKPSRAARTKVPPAKVGSVSQANKKAQAKKDG
ncbi:hypothetical protein [Caulobacter mirabilis]|uniref:Uncharacterized protein n=1 Tax=Caulobacter mirabilis TaxID=69666 RepID=A0A2D2AZW1_9CAUL|nr:hypothetical protein [Caulobacter mirabilis]ATQ43546.1 hypothetical protein CSW64_14600 [Caulobacter mirabilis]